ncbi:MAG: restriction endonuclease subunit S, partial [Muribaculaceae bacterium]|nr:restriction endonuclease subunit S [Muribaculaceae bacterium]
IGRLFTENSSLGRVALYDGEDGAANLSGNLSFIRLKPIVAPKFILYILISDYFRDYVRNTTSGGIDKRALNNSQLKALPIYLPPLELQEKFAERIEQIDAQKKAVEETIANLQTLLDSRMDYWFN